MSLDLSLESIPGTSKCTCRCGHEHVSVQSEIVFNSNMTHNVGNMLDAAGLYQILWHGDGLVAGEQIGVLRRGLSAMLTDPERFKKMSASNGWGTYEQVVPWLTKVIVAFAANPTAIIHCSI